MCKFINKEWVSRCDDYFYKEKIKRKNNSIKLTAQEIEDIVNNVKTLADKKLRFFNRNSEKILKEYLYWIFSRDNRKEPVFGIETYDNCWVDRDEDWGMI